jgi:hypothetical protein
MIPFENIQIEKLQRIAMILNFIFTTLSFKIILSYKYFSKATLFIGQLQKHVFLALNEISFGIRRARESKLEFNFTALLILSLTTLFLIIYYPDVLKGVLNFPFKLITRGVSIWQRDHQFWHYIVYPFYSFVLFLFGVILAVYLWGLVIVGNAKTVIQICGLLNKVINKRVFELSIFLLFIISWLVTFFLMGK